jgi:hypothetical protein
MITNDTKLSVLLRSARATPSLTPRFQQNVWRRIGDAEAPAKTESWLDALAMWILRPRFAVAAATALVLAGVFMGAMAGAHDARHDAQTRYVASVAPNSLR